MAPLSPQSGPGVTGASEVIPYILAKPLLTECSHPALGDNGNVAVGKPR
jgi:hypothetical protein